jgi:hypothetical protein
MKTRRMVKMILFILVTTSCALLKGGLPNPANTPSGSLLTPASLEVVIGPADPVIPVNADWPVYQNDELGISLRYPPDWSASALKETTGIGLYPPDSNPDFPTPMIRMEWWNIAFAPGKPLISTGGAITSIDVAGITGQEYQDTRFALPTQSYYLELPLRGGTLLFIATLGPSVNLEPQFKEILKTLTLSDG